MSDVAGQLWGRVAQIEGGLELAGDRLDASAVDQARQDLVSVRNRLELGVDHAVVALVGGTGSGKSTLFNAISQLNFADVGVIRPTTARASACVWGGRAEKLLDFLGVEPTRRIERESILLGDREESLRGLVLLDLPDHDSVEAANAQLVNRLLPLIDLLIWVVDPQKYADNVLHEQYLQALSARHDAMLVVVNQTDRIPEGGLQPIMEDVRRLLADDNLARVPILAASAKSGEGVEEIRQQIAQMMRTESVAARTARAEIEAIVGRLRPSVGPEQPQAPDSAGTAIALAEAAGTNAFAQSLAQATRSARRQEVGRPHPPARSRVDAIRQEWLAAATKGLPARWRESTQAPVGGSRRFHQLVSEAIEGVPVPSPGGGAARGLRWAGWALAGAGVLGAAVAAVLLSLGNANVILFAASAAAVVLGLAGILIARALRNQAAQRNSQAFRSATEDALVKVVDDELARPVLPQLAEHDSVRVAVWGTAAAAEQVAATPSHPAP